MHDLSGNALLVEGACTLPLAAEVPGPGPAASIAVGVLAASGSVRVAVGDAGASSFR